jgi:hypothetical protein
MYAEWANRGQDFIANVMTIPGGNTVWRATVKSQTLNHYATTDIANNGVQVVLPEGNNHRRVSMNCCLLSAGFADGEVCIGVRCRDHYSSLRIAFPGATE